MKTVKKKELNYHFLKFVGAAGIPTYWEFNCRKKK
jgi:hypothetical protein